MMALLRAEMRSGPFGEKGHAVVGIDEREVKREG
jgi:hypothetical protein